MEKHVKQASCIRISDSSMAQMACLSETFSAYDGLDCDNNVCALEAPIRTQLLPLFVQDGFQLSAVDTERLSLLFLKGKLYVTVETL